MSINLQRKRKTKAPCPGCRLHQSLCICELIPHLSLRTKVSLVIHAKELKRTTNTGTLALRALSNGVMFVRGAGREALDLREFADDGYRSIVFFPSDDAVELTREFVMGDPRPINLIVPDGNWRQASKVLLRQTELAGFPRVKISAPNTSRLHLRAETSPEGMATLEAIAHALRVIEGEQAFLQLIGLYQAKLERTWIGRSGGVQTMA